MLVDPCDPPIATDLQKDYMLLNYNTLKPIRSATNDEVLAYFKNNENGEEGIKVNDVWCIVD